MLLDAKIMMFSAYKQGNISELNKVCDFLLICDVITFLKQQCTTIYEAI